MPQSYRKYRVNNLVKAEMQHYARDKIGQKPCHRSNGGGNRKPLQRFRKYSHQSSESGDKTLRQQQDRTVTM